MIPKRLADEISSWINDKRYGHLQINFSAGKIVNINRTESLRIEQLESGNVDSVTLSTLAP